jgi:hypothetical protein
MSERKEAVSIRADSNGYEVEYGKPPQHTQFRAGWSGNPAGRNHRRSGFATSWRPE